jgi:hypothetical protein
MNIHRKYALGVSALGVLAALGAANCSAVEDTLSQSSGLECDEFSQNGQIDARVDAKVRAYMEATLDVQKVSVELRTKVRDACGSIARDLGAEDTWSKEADADEAVSNDRGTGACNVAAKRISAIMEAHADARFALSVTRGECHRDFQAQAACETQCKDEPVCDPGTCETRCEPGELSVKCEGKCKAEAHCEGTVAVSANCTGTCDAECSGECSGTCTFVDGHTTENDANCKGKCSAQCKGSCSGSCKVEAEAGISCGANVRCKGGCEGTYSEPTCTTTFKPGPCHVDQTCLDGCVAKAEAHQVCEPTRVELFADVKVHADVKALVDTCNKNLSVLMSAAESEGKVLVSAGERLVATGSAVVDAHADLNGKSIACAGAATKVAGRGANTVHTAGKGGADVVDTCSKHAK